jgi:transposase
VRGDPGRADIRKAAETAPPGARIKLLAVADAQFGRPDALVGLDHEVPGGTIGRWIAQFLDGGLEALVDSDLATALDGEDPEPAALAAYHAPPGVEKTALRAVAAACRGSSVSELAQYHMVPETEVEEWIGLFVEGGAEKLAARYRRRGRKKLEPEHAFIGRRRLPLDVSDTFLRNLHARCDGDFARHLLAIALAYEGRTVTQVAEAVDAAEITVSKWVNGFIRNGVAGIAPWRPAGQVPCRRNHTASSVAALAAEAVNEEYRKRLLAISDAYRGMSLYDISLRHKLAVSSIRSHIKAFETYGPMGLSSGEATVTPEMRDDYTAERLRSIASEMAGDFRCQQRLEAMAQLYDGVPMSEAAHLIGGLPAIRLMAERFNRFGHGITESFNSHSMAPKAPPPRPRPPVVRRIKPPVILEAMEMRADFDADSLAEFRDRLGNNYLLSLEIIIDTYNGVTSPQIAQQRGIPRANVTRILNTFNDRGFDWLLRAMARTSKPERAVRQKAWKEPKEPRELRFPLRTDWDARAIRNAMYRTVDEVHRRELEVVLQVYQIGKVSAVAGRMEMLPDEVTRIATDFNMHGETLGVESRVSSILPADYDEEELRLAMRSGEPLRTYAQIVLALYGGKSLGYVRTTWELKAGELETIVRAYSEMGLAGLEADPLDARAELPVPVPRKSAAAPKIAVPPPKKVVRPPKPPSEPRRPIAEPPKPVPQPAKVVAEPPVPVTVTEVPRPVPSWPFPPLPRKPPAFSRPGIPHLPADHPRRVSLADRLRSYVRVARPPHDRALSAVLLHAECGSVNSAASSLGIPPAEAESWINLYQRRGARAFLGADRLSLHPLLPPDKGSELRALALQQNIDEIYERRLLIVAASIDGDDMASICERHGVAYDEAAECIVAYDRNGLAGLERVAETPASLVNEIARAAAGAQAPPLSPAPEHADIHPEVTEPSATAMFEGKNAHRLEAVREFNRDRDLYGVAKKYNVRPQTIEKWVIGYVTTGMAEKDRPLH